VLVLTGQYVKQRCPEVGVGTEPVQNVAVKQLVSEQPRGRAVQAVFPAFTVTEAVRLLQRAVPRVPSGTVDKFNLYIHGNLADVVQQRGVSGRRRPDFGLRRLVFGTCASGQQVGLAQLQGVGDDFQPVVEHATGVGVVVVFGGRELLYQFGVTMQRCQIQRVKLLTGERRALPDMFQQYLPARSCQQDYGRFWAQPAFGEFWFRGWFCRWWL